MANEILLAYETGLTPYFTVMNAAGQRWNGSAFENYNAANWGDYDVALTEQGATGDYLGTFPASIPAGVYRLTLYAQAGGSPGVDDEKLDAILFGWDGSAEVTLHMVDGVVDAIQGRVATAIPNQAMGSSGGLASHTITQGTATAVATMLADLVNGGRLDLIFDRIQDLLEADRVVDTGVTPWALVLIKKGSGALGVGTELLRQPLYDTNGAGLTSKNSVVGKATSP